jgi:ribosomal protein S27E
MKTKLILLTLVSLSASLLVSCQAPTAPTSAVSCDRCHTIYFNAPATTTASGGKGFVSLRPANRMSCPDCENQIISWTKTGSLTRHTCKSCGGNLHHCTQH